MHAALLKETEIRKNELGNEIIETIYFGGGTPSLLPSGHIHDLIHAVKENYLLSPDAEITLEANPDDITKETLQEWKHAGVNRLSIGVQSFFDEDLQWMNRAHSSGQAIQSLEMALSCFPNISIDLIYGSPGLTDEKWKANVDRVIALGIPHISCYALTVEPKTPLDKMIRTGKSADTDPDQQSTQFLLLMEWLGQAGYEHYEISNFAKPGRRSKHNTSYWQGKKYIGIGPSAHSFNGKERQWNVANNALYMKSVLAGEIPFEKEILTPVQKINEYVMTSLRTMEGLQLGKLPADVGEKTLNHSKKYIDSGLMIHQNDAIILTNEGKLLADGIAADLFIE